MDDFLYRFITVDKTWIHNITPEGKHQSKQWISPGNSQPKNANVFPSTNKAMETNFSNARDIFQIFFLIELIQRPSQGKDISYFQTWKNDSEEALRDVGACLLQSKKTRLKKKCFVENPYFIQNLTNLLTHPCIYTVQVYDILSHIECFSYVSAFVISLEKNSISQ